MNPRRAPHIATRSTQDAQSIIIYISTLSTRKYSGRLLISQVYKHAEQSQTLNIYIRAQISL